MAQKILATEGAPVPEWLARLLQVVSLISMLKFYARPFIEALSNLEFMINVAEPSGLDTAVTDDDLSGIQTLLDTASEQCQLIELNFSVALVKQAKVHIKATENITYRKIREEVAALQRAIYTELETAYFLLLPPQNISLYEDEPQFGEPAAMKFPKAVTDIQEAAKCLALRRASACVFHLMRVMELAVQYLGKRLSINLVTEKNWHNILDEVDKAIKAMPVKGSRQKAMRNKFAEASAHLRMVKDAWRNEVMHPKETYTEEEAERIFFNVKDFMVQIATKL